MNPVYHEQTPRILNISRLESRIFSWLSQSSWGIKEVEFYLSERSKKFTFSFCLAKTNDVWNPKGAVNTDSWVLKIGTEIAGLWADLVRVSTKFTKLRMTLGGPGCRDEQAQDAIEFLISSQILIHQADAIELVTANPDLKKKLTLAYGDSNSSRIWSPGFPTSSKTKKNEGFHFTLFRFSAEEWWANPKQEDIRNSLDYVKRRSERQSRNHYSQRNSAKKNHKRVRIGLNQIFKTFRRKNKGNMTGK